MEKDENVFDFGLDDTEEKIKEIKYETFISEIAGPRSHKVNTHNAHGTLRILHFKCEADKDYAEGSKFVLCKLPQSQVRILGTLSNIEGSIQFIVGWAGFINRYREKRPGVTDGIMSPDTNMHVFGRAKLQSPVFDSLEGVEVYATALSDGKKGDNIEGYFIYVKK